MAKTTQLLKRPDLVLLLEKYDLVPKETKGKRYRGAAKQWALRKRPPYDKPEYQALADRLPAGWEELTQDEMDELLDKLRQAIVEKKKRGLETANAGSRQMLKSLAKVAFLAIAATAATLVENGIGILPDQYEKEKEIAKEFSFELTLHLINGTDFLTHLFKSIAETVDTDLENQVLIAEILKGASIFLAIITVAKGSDDKLGKLLISFKNTLNQSLLNAEKFVSLKLEKGEIKGDLAERIGLYINQVRLSLDRDDFQGFKEAFTYALEALGIDLKSFDQDISKIHVFAKNLKSAIYAGSAEESSQTTTLSQAM